MKRERTAGFRQMVEALRVQSMERTFRRAQCASRCAKFTENRRVAYEVKNVAISRALQLAPDRVEIGDRSLLPQGIVGLFVQDLGGLHVPLQALTPVAAVIVRQKLHGARGAPAETRQ